MKTCTLYEYEVNIHYGRIKGTKTVEAPSIYDAVEIVEHVLRLGIKETFEKEAKTNGLTWEFAAVIEPCLTICQLRAVPYRQDAVVMAYIRGGSYTKP